MRNIPAALAAHLQGDVTTLAVCWRVQRADGVLILGTEHDRDITVDAGSPTADLAGTYRAGAGITGSNVRSSSDMSVDNVDVEGAVNTGDLNLVDLSPADIEAGLFDDASVTLFLVNWQAPDDGQIILRTGNIGEISRTAEGQYRTELRGIKQKLAQNMRRFYSVSCDADLYDSRCGVNVGLHTYSGSIDSVVTPRREFGVAFDSPSPLDDSLTGGKITFTSGACAGFSMEIKEHTGPTLVLYQPMPLVVAASDAFTAVEGCNKLKETCVAKFNNLVNFRGHAFYVPNQLEVLKVGGQ